MLVHNIHYQDERGQVHICWCWGAGHRRISKLASLACGLFGPHEQRQLEPTWSQLEANLVDLSIPSMRNVNGKSTKVNATQRKLNTKLNTKVNESQRKSTKVNESQRKTSLGQLGTCLGLAGVINMSEVDAEYAYLPLNVCFSKTSRVGTKTMIQIYTYMIKLCLFFWLTLHKQMRCKDFHHALANQQLQWRKGLVFTSWAYPKPCVEKLEPRPQGV